jgi:hypothetical protein
MSENKRIKLLKHFNKNNSEYFIKNISVNGIDYKKFFNCLLVKDITAIYNVIKSVSASVDEKSSSKLNYITFLSDHFTSQDINYFLDKIAKIDNINYKNYLKCLSAKNIDIIFQNVKDSLSSSSDEAGAKSPSGLSGLLGLTNLSLSSPPKSPMGAKVSADKPVKQPKQHIWEFLPFDTERKPADFNKIVEELNTKYKRSNIKKQNAIMKLAQLFKGEVITMPTSSLETTKAISKADYKPMKIEIIGYLSLRDNTLLYIGKVLEGPQKDTNVVVKVQPRIPKGVKLDISIQVTTELHIMSMLHKNCKDILAPKAYAYGSINPLVPGDIERYILVSELLGKDLSRSLKSTSTDNIKKNVILAIKALQLMHKCNGKNSYLHLDIKHENIAFTDSSETAIKIIDFGTAEDIYDRHGKRKLEPRTPGEGTPMYMSIMQHEKSVMDYMDDLQAFAWMLLDLLGDRQLHTGMPWYGDFDNIARKNLKLEYITNCKNDDYTNNYANGTLTKHNMAVIGELAAYTMYRADKPNKYDTDLKTPTGLYYCNYNDKYYDDIIKIINKLE